MTTNLDSNKALVRSFIAAWNERDFDRFDTLMGRDAVLSVGGMTVSCNPAGTRAIAEEWTTVFPDWRFDLLTLIAEGDRVAARMPYSGTFANPIAGIAPTGRVANVDEIVIFRFEDAGSFGPGRSTTSAGCGDSSASLHRPGDVASPHRRVERWGRRWRVEAFR